MGIFQPAGAGTAIHIYDDNDTTNRGATTGPHTAAQINAAFPVDFPLLQTAAGATFSATHRQYLPAVTVNFGHPTAGNANLTSFVDTSGCDIFGVGTRLQWPSANAATQTFIMGTKIGTGIRMSGKNGGTIHQSGNIVFRGTVGLYGCYIESTTQIQLLNGTAVYMEVASSTLMAGTSFVIGNSDLPNFRLYNMTFCSSTTGVVATALDGIEAGNVVLAATSPTTFCTSASSNRSLRNFVLSGAPTASDIRVNGGAIGWEFTNVTWSDTPGLPRIFLASTTSVPDGHTDYRTFNTKVVDLNGNALSGIPIYLESDTEGLLVDDVTDQDGDVEFTFGPTGQSAVPVRVYYSNAISMNALAQDSVFTLTVNGYGALTAPNPNYKTYQQTFEWAGRDKFGTGYQTDGGSFEPLTALVQLLPGSPSHAPLWTECEVVP